MASVRKREWTAKDGETKTAWVADYFDNGGKRRLKTFTTKKAADAWLLKARTEVVAGTHTADSVSVTIAEAAKHWITRAELDHLERSTINKYKNHVDLHITPYIGAVKLSRLNAPAVQKFKDETLVRASRPMAKKILGSLKAILSEAQRRGLVSQNVASMVKIKTPSRLQGKLTVGVDLPTKEEVKALLDKVDDRWRPFLVTLIFTGMRSSEMRGLRWVDLDFSKKVINVRQRVDQWNVVGSPKSAAGTREIPMSPLVLNSLKEWKLRCPKAKADKDDPGVLVYVFPNGSGKVESHSNIVNRCLDPLQIAAGVSVPHPKLKDEDDKPVMVAKYGLHSFRHWFASYAIEQKFSAKKLQDMLGHSSITMTFDTYGHLFPSTEDDQEKFSTGEKFLLSVN